MQEETTIDSTEESFEDTKLPTFLKVICILSFVGVGLGIASTLWSITPSAINSNYTTMTTEDLGPFGVFDIPFDEYSTWIRYSGIAGIVGCLLAGIGAILMWKRKKVGFYLYIPSWIIPTVVGFMSLSHLMPSGMIGIGMITQILSLIVGIAFIIMYAVNLKHMR